MAQDNNINKNKSKFHKTGETKQEVHENHKQASRRSQRNHLRISLKNKEKIALKKVSLFNYGSIYICIYVYIPS